MTSYVYMLKCSNNAYYTGYTTDLGKRYQEHVAGEGAKYTRSFKPLEIACAWRIFLDKAFAMKIEAHIKALSRKEKLKLIANPQTLVGLFGVEWISVEQIAMDA